MSLKEFSQRPPSLMWWPNELIHSHPSRPRNTFVVFIFSNVFINPPQDGDSLHIKVAEVIPKFTFLGKSLDEALNLQKQHEDLLLNIQVERPDR